MRKYVLFLLVLVMMAIAVPAAAQDSMQITVPFSFHVGAVLLPPGQYVITSPTNSTLMVRALDGKTPAVRALIREIASEKPDMSQPPDRTSKVIFHMQEGSYTLHTIQTLNMTHAHDIVHAEADVQ